MENYKQHVLNELESQFARGQTVWQQDFREGELRQTVPYNPVSGLLYSGIAETLLRNKAIEKGYADPRWVTAYQAYQQGWKLKPEAEKTKITVGALHYDTLSKRTVHKYHTLYNAEVIEGIPAREKVRIPGLRHNVYLPEYVRKQINEFCVSNTADLSTVIARSMLATEAGVQVKNAQNKVSKGQLKDFFKCYAQALRIKDAMLEPKVRERQPLVNTRQRQVALGMGY